MKRPLKPTSIPTELTNLDWENSLLEARKSSEKRAWVIAKFAGVLACLSVVALSFALPLQKTITRVIEVDKLTGESAIVGDLSAYVSTRNDVNDKYWLKRFVTAHERYNFYSLQFDFDTVKDLSGDAVYSKYKSQFEGANALQEKYGNKVEIIPTILSEIINSKDKGIATVRYELKVTTNNTQVPPTILRNVATITYHYAPNSFSKEKTLIDNPLGFVIDAFQVDPEVATESTIAAPVITAVDTTEKAISLTTQSVPAIGSK